MKLIIAIVNNDDSMAVSSALTRHDFFVTKLSTTGGFLMIGNTTYLIGAEERVDQVREILAKYSQKRSHTVTSKDSFGYGFREGELEKEVTVGGATMFVLDVESMEKF